MSTNRLSFPVLVLRPGEGIRSGSTGLRLRSLVLGFGCGFGTVRFLGCGFGAVRFLGFLGCLGFLGFGFCFGCGLGWTVRFLGCLGFGTVGLG